MSRVTRAEKLLYNLAAAPNCELSKLGADYVKQRFDPYHDLPMKPVGYPDGYAGSTVARCVKKSVTVSATSGEGSAPATTWNLHIFDTPIERPVSLTQNTGGNTNVFGFSSTPNDFEPYGGLMAVRSDNSNWSYPPTNASGFLVGALQLADADLKNCMRVVASGFEVIDETAALYRQGTLTAYRQNQPQFSNETITKVCNSGTGINATTNIVEVTSAQKIKFPPMNTADAMLIPGTKQWKTEEGAYVVCDYNSDELPMVDPQYIEPALIADNATIPILADNVIGFMPVPVNSGVTQNFTVASTLFTETFRNGTSNRLTPKNQSGVFLTGLNPQASITINKIWYLECAPAGEDEELLTLCTQSPEDDPLARKMVAALRRASPVAVKLYENYMGEWFFDGVKSLVNKVMPWLSNAQIVGNQVVKWVDSANANNGYIMPQSLVRGPVAPQVAKEKKKDQPIIIKKTIPKAPGPAPVPKNKVFVIKSSEGKSMNAIEPRKMKKHVKLTRRMRTRRYGAGDIDWGDGGIALPANPRNFKSRAPPRR